jgi:hypothetical protein
MRQVIPLACIPTTHGFPFWDVGGQEVHRPVTWGWYGRIPFAPIEADKPAPSYLWLLARSGAFLHREHLWEDSPRSAIPGGVGLFHLVGNAILVVRFLSSFATKLQLPNSARFRVNLSVNNIAGRYLEDEKSGWASPYRKKATEAIVSAAADIQVADVVRRPSTVVIGLVEEVAWQFGRDDLRRQNIEEAIKRAPDHLGEVYRIKDEDST